MNLLAGQRQGMVGQGMLMLHPKVTTNSATVVDCADSTAEPICTAAVHGFVGSTDSRTSTVAPSCAEACPKNPRRRVDRCTVISGPVIGGNEVVSDCEGERKHAAAFDLPLVVADFSEQRSEVLHPPIVDSPESSGHCSVAARPAPHRKIDCQEVVPEGECPSPTHLMSRVPTLGFDACYDVFGAGLLPRVQHLVEECLAICEVPVEASPGHP